MNADIAKYTEFIAAREEQTRVRGSKTGWVIFLQKILDIERGNYLFQLPHMVSALKYFKKFTYK